ncbi:hypothetical protein IKS57_01740 [bacterium]|nr:hypothetical protein [bacterium]
MNEYERLEQKIDANKEEILGMIKELHKHEKKINNNSNRIQKNTGALELLHTLNNVKKRFFVMWASTFIALIVAIGCIIYLLCR